jgi:hypothetical protein
MYRHRPKLELQGVEVEAPQNFFLPKNSFMVTQWKREK